jgi:hypothetical protein
MRPERNGSMYGFHGSACPFHCVCNDTHLSWGCWCNVPRGKAPRRRPWWWGLRVWLLGGGRALGYFDCPPELREKIWGKTR